ncbi:MAG TPA: redoxin domain-containing protein [Leptospiraceae bacterium]|nr:redoxin domain-containing protein [Leptospiraceae bacterium]HMW08157.1 redoxin domain-containing protein [Leptospiraceae bacterium]HMX32943.1 redoxin domain-containing protein [Leptospiraceae bacterium]HMY33960.1 redoxin domain-containing protein [Leptospiraceae bacterium]HMZ65681.1 redoxin domain-containing protein [Leptospiraceae bacterium]
MKTIKILLIFFISLELVSSEVHNLPVYDLQDERYTIHSTLSNFTKEKLLLINFTNSNCKPCKIEIPKLLQLHEKLSSQGLVLWIVFVGDNNDTIEPLVKEFGIGDNVKVMKDPLEISYKRMKFTGVPANFIVSKNKEISYTSIGYTDQKQKALEKKVEELMK